MVTDLFITVENKNVKVRDLSQPVMPFIAEDLGTFTRFNAVNDKNTLKVYWALPYCMKEITTQPLSYLSHLFGHEGKNSLLSWLKKEGLAMGLSAGGSHMLNCMSNFSVNVSLTKKGLENY